MNGPIVLKIGDTYDLVGSLDVNGVAQDLTGCTITSQVRQPSGAVVWDCVVSSVDSTHYRLQAAASVTGAAPEGTMVSDVRYEWTDGRVETTPTFSVQLVRRVTT